MFSGYGVPPVRRSPRCAWGWSVAWDAGLPQDALVATQRRNGRAFSSLTARGGGLPVGVRQICRDRAHTRLYQGRQKGKEPCIRASGKPTTNRKTSRRPGKVSPQKFVAKNPCHDGLP